MNKMRLLPKLMYFSIILLVSASCATISYTPKISLDLSPQTIMKSVQIERIKDVSPAKDRNNPLGGLSVTNQESLPNGLELEVTNEIVSDFSNNALFEKVSRRIDNPDLIIKGEIKEFFGKSKTNAYTIMALILSTPAYVLPWATLQPAWLLAAIPMGTLVLGAPSSKNTSIVEISLEIYNQNGDLLGTYTGRADEKNSTNIYKNTLMAVPGMTNLVFSSAIQSIRDQILEDIDKYK